MWCVCLMSYVLGFQSRRLQNWANCVRTSSFNDTVAHIMLTLNWCVCICVHVHVHVTTFTFLYPIRQLPALKNCRTWLWMESFKIRKRIPCCCTSLLVTSQIGWVQITYYSSLIRLDGGSRCVEMLYLTERLLLGYDTRFSNSFSNYQTNSRLLCFLSWSGKIPARYTHVHTLCLMQAFPWYWNNRNVVSVRDCNYRSCIAQDYNGRALHTEDVSKLKNYGRDVIWIWLKKSEMLCGWHSGIEIGSNTPTIMHTV